MGENEKFRNNVVMEIASVSHWEAVSKPSHKFRFSKEEVLVTNTNMSDLGLRTPHPSGGYVHERSGKFLFVFLFVNSIV